MEEWDVYYLFVRNRNVTTNGYPSATVAGNQLSGRGEVTTMSVRE